MNRTYIGSVNATNCIVTVQEGDRSRPLPMYTVVINHSPTGFAWGYAGSGPAQLALAMLITETNDKERALAHYQAFKREVISELDIDKGWTMTSAYIRQWLERVDSGKEESHAEVPANES